MTKKTAALHALGIARSIHQERAGDEEADVWIIRLLWLAADLDPAIQTHAVYAECLGDGDSRRAKLRRLIEHPATSAVEREAAIAALGRVGASL